ncbi:MAG TPA: DUF1800 domain-containing protein [Blastocatellia bacterium]|nr:DUF1800 domain-containing protein [Blastocatellia bacterium]
MKAIRRSSIAASVIALVVCSSLALGSVGPTSAGGARKLTEDQKIIHVLNRLGYGPRPGDVERVRRIGLERYIEQQLNPSKIDDTATEARLTGLASLKMTVAEIYDKYPQPAEVARKLGLFNPAQALAQGKPGEPMAQGDDPAAKEEDRERRRKVLSYYMENGLKPPNILLQELQAQKIIRAVYSERQLQEVMTDFWFNHFNVYWAKGADRWLTSDFEMNAIRPHTLGKFKDLLLATAKSPAMLFYLDNFQSMSPDAELPGRRMNRRGNRAQRRGLFGDRTEMRRTNRRLDEMERAEIERDQMQREQVEADKPEQEANPEQMTPEQRRQRAMNQLRARKRGINENYAREIMELHTLGVDSGYTQKDVQEVARAFTGWTIQQPRQNGVFIFRAWMHDNGEKVVLGQKIPSGGGIKDGERVIEILAVHPATARFISTKLARRFVSDNPPKSLIDKVAAVYTKTDGDITSMLRAIFTSQEFYSAEAYRAKIKSPFELAVSAVRALGGETNGAGQVAQFVARMGQPLYLYQTPTGYPDRAEQWVNTGALLERLNFGIALSANRVRGTVVDLNRAAGSGETSRPPLDRAILMLLNGEISSETRAIIDRQLKEGVPVKGELGSARANALATGDSAAVNDSMSADNARLNRKGQYVERKGRGRRGDRFDIGGGPAAQAATDSELAQVFGLVLGSPEFQRR